MWRSLVAHLLWEQGAGGSNPLTPTSSYLANRLPDEYLVHDLEHHPVIERLRDRARGAEVQRLREEARVPAAPASRHRDDRQPRELLPHLHDRFDAFLFRHEDVDDREIGGRVPLTAQTLDAVARQHDVMAVELQGGFEQRADVRLVVDHEDSRHGEPL